jgi:hypothetical protein
MPYPVAAESAKVGEINPALIVAGSETFDLVNDQQCLPEAAPHMQFRLTYAGPLKAQQNRAVDGKKDRKSDHKHALRLAFHEQLKRLWEITPHLARGQRDDDGMNWVNGENRFATYKAEDLAKKHNLFGWNFVPLITKELDLVCSLDILLLRPDGGSGVVSGDIDNRLKVLFDALQIPDANQEYQERGHLEDDAPLYVLLENDMYIENLKVETDRMLQIESINKSDLVNFVRLIINVKVRPFNVRNDNYHFT